MLAAVIVAESIEVVAILLGVVEIMAVAFEVVTYFTVRSRGYTGGCMGYISIALAILEFRSSWPLNTCYTVQRRTTTTFIHTKRL